jgi:O-methyltransferase
MGNTFILDLQRKNLKVGKKHKILAKIIKLFNPNNNLLKLKFKDDNFNRYFDIKYNIKYDEHVNQLKDGMVNVEQAVNIYHLLTRVLIQNIPGEVVELGCYEGTTAIIMEKTLDELKSKKRIHVYDSFEGLPKKEKEDGNTYYKEGQCRTSIEKMINNFKENNVKLPVIHKGWFKDTLPEKLPKEICFAHLDSDFYTSIKESLENVYPRLSKGAIVVIDDYCDPKILNVFNILPGVKKACDEFFHHKKEKMQVLLAGSKCHGFFVKE